LTTPAIGAGIPSQWLARRPDIARAEALLAAADADIFAARAALLPSINLGAEVTSSGAWLRQAFDHPAWSLLAGLTAPLFNAGRLAAGRELSEAARAELLANYRQTILSAFADVELALNEVAGLEGQSRLHAEERDAARHALTLAESRYRAGAETLITLLGAQRTLYAAQDETARLKLARLQAAVSLYKALGGGWQAKDAERP
ncbi:MAG: TolC family protein, partial [Zoogloeaceae bacterium]|nr:TolC family protein [Zoogloeaceae bacterium]